MAAISANAAAEAADVGVVACGREGASGNTAANGSTAASGSAGESGSTSGNADANGSAGADANGGAGAAAGGSASVTASGDMGASSSESASVGENVGSDVGICVGSSGCPPVPVVLLHGFAQTVRSWNDVAAALRAQGHTVYVPDLPASSMDAACAKVANLVYEAACEAGAPVALVGYSMGGRIALETLVRCGALPAHATRFESGNALASASQLTGAPQLTDAFQPAGALRSQPAGTPRPANTPQLASAPQPFAALPLAALVLESAGLGPSGESARAVLAKRNCQWARNLREQGVEAFMDQWEALPLFASQRTLPPAVREAVRSERVSRSADELASVLEQCGQHHQASEGTSLATLAQTTQAGVRVAYFAGGLDQKYVAVAQRVAQEVPQATIHMLEGAGHNLHLEQTQLFLRALSGILQSLP